MGHFFANIGKRAEGGALEPNLFGSIDKARPRGRRTGEQAEAVAARRSSGGAAERTTVGSGGEDATDLPLRSDIPIAYLYHPLFQWLLEAARDTYGYSSAGPLWLPCCVDEFLRLRALVDRETTHSHSSSYSHRVHVQDVGHQQHGNSFAPCTRAKITS
ncbi:auxin-responsive protein SAUR32-like [Triticum aestivum]|uniref:auxin-responsive protein SAUR32-like n=1 Tax=Triticum aestivum TaxID=4565 RepID=UPI001D002C95|nr:auxin-responsive protein SAUR32-like [Triticum aestivum]